MTANFNHEGGYPSGPYQAWRYPPDYIPLPYEFSSDFEVTHQQHLLQWWDPRLNDGVPDPYNFKTWHVLSLGSDIVEHPTEPGRHCLELRGFSYPISPAPHRVDLGSLHFEPSWLSEIVSIEFDLLIDAPRDRSLNILFDIVNVEFGYNKTTDSLSLDVGEHTDAWSAPRSDDWVTFRFNLDYLHNEVTFSVNGEVVLDRLQPWGYIFSDYGMWWEIGGGTLSTAEEDKPGSLDTYILIDNLVWDNHRDTSVHWSEDFQEPGYEPRFGWISSAYWPTEVTEGDRTFLRFDGNSKELNRPLAIHDMNRVAFDLRMDDPVEEEFDAWKVFTLRYSVSIDEYHDIYFYDWADVLTILYDSITDCFRLANATTWSGGLSYFWMGPEDLEVSWPRTPGWHRIEVEWDYPGRAVTLLVDDEQIASYAVRQVVDISFGWDPWGDGYPMNNYGVNWEGWLSAEWGDYAAGTWNDSALFDLDNISLSGMDAPTIDELALARDARPGGVLFEIQWNGTDWVDETAYLILPVTGDEGLILGGSLAQLGRGQTPVAEMRVVVDNQDGRYSQTHAGSQAATHGIYQRRARFSAGFLDPLGEPVTTQTFTGRIQDVREGQRQRRAELVVNCEAKDIQQIRMQALPQHNLRSDQIIQAIATSSGYYNLDLDHGYCVVPWWYSDDDDAYAEMSEVAESEMGVVWLDPADGCLYFFAWDHWLNALSVTTYGLGPAGGVGGFEDLQLSWDYQNALDQQVVHFQPQRKDPLDVAYQLTEALVIPPDSTKSEELKFFFPCVFHSYEMVATTAGGEDLNADVSLHIAAPQSATSWYIEFTNANTRHAAVIRTFNVLGYPLAGLSSRRYSHTAGSATVSRRSDTQPTPQRARFCIQTMAQARLIAELRAWRLQQPPAVYTVGPERFHPNVKPGAVITVAAAGGVAQIEKDLVVLHRQWRYGERFEMTLTCAARDDLYELTAAEYFRVGTSTLGVGALGY